MISVLAKLSLYCIHTVLQFCSRETVSNNKRGTCRIGKKVKGLYKKYSSLSSQTSKGNSRNYGDFSEEFHEIDVILLERTRTLCNTGTLLTKEGIGWKYKWNVTSTAIRTHTWYMSRLSRWLRFPPLRFLREVLARAFGSRIPYSYR